MTAHATMSLEQPAPGAPALAHLVKEAELDGALPEDDIPLYAPRRKIIRRASTARFAILNGRFWSLRSASITCFRSCAGIATQRAVAGGSDRFPNRRFYFFFIEIWPQEVYYLTGLLILAAIVLFLMNAVAGRIWCGSCPRDRVDRSFFAIERFVG